MTDIAELRHRLGLSQREFAERYRLSLHTVRGWEIGRAPKAGAAAILLELIAREPETIARILASDHAGVAADVTGRDPAIASSPRALPGTRKNSGRRVSPRSSTIASGQRPAGATPSGR